MLKTTRTYKMLISSNNNWSRCNAVLFDPYSTWVYAVFQSSESRHWAYTLIYHVHWTTMCQALASPLVQTSTQKQQWDDVERTHCLNGVLHNYFRSFSSIPLHTYITTPPNNTYGILCLIPFIFFHFWKHVRSSIIYTHNALWTGAIPLVVMMGCSPSSSFSLLAWILPW